MIVTKEDIYLLRRMYTDDLLIMVDITIKDKESIKVNYLSKDEIIKSGIEFIGEVCYSGEYGEQVYTKELDEGGIPVEGILYERYENGNIIYYEFCKDGIPNGIQVWFYHNGNIKSYCVMDGGTIDGEYIEWYENGEVKIRKNCKYGLVLTMQEFDESGRLVNEKKELLDYEKNIYEKYSGKVYN